MIDEDLVTISKGTLKLGKCQELRSCCCKHREYSIPGEIYALLTLMKLDFNVRFDAITQYPGNHNPNYQLTC